MVSAADETVQFDLSDMDWEILARVAAEGPEGMWRNGACGWYKPIPALERAGYVELKHNRYVVTSEGLDALSARRCK